jgi:hypothetical protein
MAAAKKKPPIQASEVRVGNRTLEGVLIDLAEQVKANDARSADRTARLEEVLADCAKRSATAEERSAAAEERSARAEEMAALALRSLGPLLQDLRATTQEMRDFNGKTDGRLAALENTAGA